MPNLVYQDFYKFIMSAGIALFMFNLVLIGQGWFPPGKIFLLWIILLLSIRMMFWAGIKWYRNQKLYDEQEFFKTEKLKIGSIVPLKQEGLIEIRILNAIRNYIMNKAKHVINKIKKGKTGIAVVSYKIASSFPEHNTKLFDFLTDGQVWFLIENHERKRYKAYITIEFNSDDLREKARGSYDGTHGWVLNALSGVIAPGLGIPQWVKKKALERKTIKIIILCEIRDENDNLIEKKLPAEYVYNYENNSWYYNPAPEKRDGLEK